HANIGPISVNIPSRLMRAILEAVSPWPEIFTGTYTDPSEAAAIGPTGIKGV
ncbi:MAG: hypothetical protein JWO67_2472, partial [Streptosporangiaceae bacterium]|nr:hypothetical protein [Streptosporangiaceae bacterium]